MFPWVLLCAGACVVLLCCEKAVYRPGIWIAKPLAAAAFVAAALAVGAAETGYGRWVLLALCLSWLGDVLLIPRERDSAFLAGIGSFLLAHVAFGVAFGLRGIEPTALGIAALLAVGGVFVALRWLRPHLDDRLRRAIPAYAVVIGAMVALAASASVAADAPAIGAGALLFAISDVSVARDRLVCPEFANSVWGLPLYFGAQLLLASTVATP